MTLRIRLGVWLLKPALLAHLRHAMQEHAQHAHHPVDPKERYWMGRCTGVRQILDPHSIRHPQE